MSDERHEYTDVLDGSWDLDLPDSDTAPPDRTDEPSGGPRRRRPFFAGWPPWILVFLVMGAVGLERISMLLVVSDAPQTVVMLGGGVFLAIVLTVLFVGGTVFYRYSGR